MITNLKIKGFKSFHDMDIKLAPFVAIAGLNGVGKSNLFDAIQLLARLSQMDVRTALQDKRGAAHELFSQYANGERATIMSFEVELLVQDSVQDAWGDKNEIRFIRLRYKLELERRTAEKDVERVYVKEEDLRPIAREDDKWLKEFFPDFMHPTKRPRWLPKIAGGRVPFIDTDKEKNTIHLRQDKGSRGRPRPSTDLTQTVLSSVNTTEFPHALAVRQAMQRWYFFQLNPDELRKPASVLTAGELMGYDGSNLAGMLFAMKAQNQHAMNDISRTMTQLVTGVNKVDVVKDEVEKRYVVQITMTNKQVFTASVLSEGTLRMLALCALLYNPNYQGTFCFEEPENGIHPTRIRYVLDLFRKIAAFKDDGKKMPLYRQVVINTHSPLVIAALKKDYYRTPFVDIYFARLAGHSSGINVSKFFHIPKQIEVFTQEEAMSLMELEQYLQLEDLKN